MKAVPLRPTNEMLAAGHAALSKIYPPKDNGGSAIGQYVVYEAMLKAAPVVDLTQTIKDLREGAEYCNSAKFERGDDPGGWVADLLIITATALENCFGKEEN